MDNRTLAHLVAVIAADLEDRGFQFTGPLRDAARRLHQIANDGCRQCGQPVEHLTTGRPRLFCGDTCRQRAHRRAIVTKADTS